MSSSVVPDPLLQFHASEKLSQVLPLPEKYQTGIESGTLYNLEASSLEYSDDYFLKEYEAQYGCTYLADESKIRQFAKERLARLQEYKKPSAAMLEIGSATGFFLDEARQLGYKVKGCEISNFAANYAKEQFNLDIYQGSFLKMPREKFDVIIAFYVIEHFSEQKALFQKISSMLKPNGILMYAMPSTQGPMFEFHASKWAETHPTDHFVDYDPASIRRVLQYYDMQLLACRPASFHQKRCTGWKRLLPGFMYQKYALANCYGDTMEGIAQRL